MENSFASRVISLIGFAVLILPCCYAQFNPDAYLTLQNEVRASVNSDLEPLQWSDDLASQTAVILDDNFLTVCALDVLQSVDGLTVEVGGLDLTPSGAVDSWVSLEGSYNYQTNTCIAPTCTPYLQVVNRETTSVGCTRSVCDNDQSLAAVACKYDVAAKPSVRPY